MASRKSAKKKKTKSTASKKTTSAKNTPKKKRVAKKASSPKTVSKKAATKISAARKVAAPNKKARNTRSQAAFPQERMTGRSGQLSGDLQGLYGAAGADSESVDELLEEGNAFEADAVKGIEDAGNKPMREVHTREVPEDDVPEEYLDPER
jgi:hypothetical protein